MHLCDPDRGTMVRQGKSKNETPMDRTCASEGGQFGGPTRVLGLWRPGLWDGLVHLCRCGTSLPLGAPTLSAQAIFNDATALGVRVEPSQRGQADLSAAGKIREPRATSEHPDSHRAHRCSPNTSPGELI